MYTNRANVPKQKKQKHNQGNRHKENHAWACPFLVRKSPIKIPFQLQLTIKENNHKHRKMDKMTKHMTRVTQNADLRGNSNKLNR